MLSSGGYWEETGELVQGQHPAPWPWCWACPGSQKRFLGHRLTDLVKTLLFKQVGIRKGDRKG